MMEIKNELIKALNNGSRKILKSAINASNSAFELGWTFGHAGLSLEEATYLKDCPKEKFEEELNKRFKRRID